MSSAAISMIDQIEADAELPTLYDQIIRSSHLRCMEPKDKIFGLLGFVNPASHTIKPDYAIPVQCVLNEVLRIQHNLVPPQDLEVVGEHIRALADALGPDVKTMFHADYWLPDDASEDYKQEMQKFPLSFAQPAYGSRYNGLAGRDSPTFPHQPLGLNLWWALAHRHEAIVRLCVKGDDTLRQLHQRKWEYFQPYFKEVFFTESLHAYRTSEKALEMTLPDATRLPLGRRRQVWEDQPVFILLDMMIAYGQSLGVPSNSLETWRQRDFRILRCLREKACPLTPQQLDSAHVLHLAIRYGRSRLQQCLLAYAELDVNCIDPGGTHCLTLAIAHNEFDTLVRILLQSDAIRFRLSSSKTLSTASPLDLAMKNYQTRSLSYPTLGWPSLFKLLLSLETLDVNSQDGDGATVLHRLSKGRWSDHSKFVPVLQEFLVNKRVDVNAQNKYGESPLHCALMNMNTVYRDSLEHMAQIIDAFVAHENIDINAKTYSGCTVLHYVSRWSDDDMVAFAITRLLQRPDIDVLAQNNAGETPLRTFTNAWIRPVAGLSKVTGLLVAKGADPEDAVFDQVVARTCRRSRDCWYHWKRDDSGFLGIFNECVRQTASVADGTDLADGKAQNWNKHWDSEAPHRRGYVTLLE